VVEDPFLVQVDRFVGRLSSKLVHNRHDPEMIARCEKLVLRYLNSDNPSFDELFVKVKEFSGSTALDITLMAATRAMEYDITFRRDRLHRLRAIILDRLGRFAEATESCRASLRWDNNHTETRKLLIKAYLKCGSYKLARLEIEKILPSKKSDMDVELYGDLLRKLDPAA